jgi:geranylgeranyl pyrophosphate synthase
VRLRLFALLAEAIGASGLTGGQSLDAEAHDRRLSIDDLEALYLRRTGALIRASVLMAAACAPQATVPVQQSLGEFATALALALRTRRDLRTAPGEQHRAGHPQALGPEATRQRLDRLHTRALEALQPLGPAGEPLRELAGWALADRPGALFS